MGYRLYTAPAPGQGEAVQYELALLRRAFTLAVQQGRLPSRPAFPHIRVNNARIGFFSPAEFEAVVQELPAPLKNVAVFGYFTGWRKSEILGLTWGAVDLESGIVRLEPTSSVAGTSTKNDHGRTFPAGALPQLVTALRNQRAYTDDVQRRTGQIVPWVFHREGRQIKKMDETWRAACKRAGVPDKLFHDFRRTSARNLLRAGVPEHWAMRLTGHKTTEVFRRYAITSEADLRDAVSRLAAATPDQTVRLLRTATV